LNIITSNNITIISVAFCNANDLDMHEVFIARVDIHQVSCRAEAILLYNEEKHKIVVIYP
jgi:hypothetical protein